MLLLQATLLIAAAASAASKDPEKPSPFLLGFKKKPSKEVPKESPGEPLFLTPYIESGNVTQGQAAALVPPLAGSVESYAGFLTVNDKLGSNMFFWFFPAERHQDRAPVVLWLQGGPGTTSLFGLFVENGPFKVLTPDDVTLREVYSWSSRYNMLYIDNPVGTGYSFTRKRSGYATNQEDVGRDLLNAVEQFFLLFPRHQGREFFIAGESYAGKYIPALARAIQKGKSKAKVRINLQGLLIGDGWCDPENMVQFSEYLYQIGLLDTTGRNEFKKKEAKIAKRIRKKRWMDAFHELEGLILGDDPKRQTLFTKLTGYNYMNNFLLAQEPSEDHLFESVVQTVGVRRALHVGNSKWNSGSEVAKHLQKDFMQSVAPWIAELLDHYRVLLYSGQLDIAVGIQQTDNFVKHMRWSGSKRWEKTPRKIWKERDQVAGYSKTEGRLTHLVVRDAGNIAPADQPELMLDALNRFVEKKAFG